MSNETTGLGQVEASATRATAGRAAGRPRRNDYGDRGESARGAERVPMHKQKTVDADTVPDNVHRHWALDSPGRIDSMLRAGYSFVHKDGKAHSGTILENGIDSRISKPVGGGTLYLMEIPIELYREDQLEKQRRADEQRAAVTGNLSDAGGFYGRDEYGNQVSAAQATRVKITNEYT